MRRYTHFSSFCHKLMDELPNMVAVTLEIVCVMTLKVMVIALCNHIPKLQFVLSKSILTGLPDILR